MERNLINKLSKDLELTQNELLNESLTVFLEKELREAAAEILQIKVEYGVSSLEELKTKIKKGVIREHPTWEKIIYWENLRKKIKVINHWAQKLAISS